MIAWLKKIFGIKSYSISLNTLTKCKYIEKLFDYIINNPDCIADASGRSFYTVNFVYYGVEMSIMAYDHDNRNIYISVYEGYSYVTKEGGTRLIGVRVRIPEVYDIMKRINELHNHSLRLEGRRMSVLGKNRLQNLLIDDDKLERVEYD